MNVSSPKSRSALRILVAGVEPELIASFEDALSNLGYPTEFAENGEEAVAALREALYSLVLLDLTAPPARGLDILAEIRRFDAHIPVLVSSHGSAPGGIVDALKGGATDLLIKPFTGEDLERAIHKAIHSVPAAWIAEAAPSPAFGRPKGSEPWLTSGHWSRKLDLFLQQVGPSDVPVLILGETGAGKEVLARAIHARSPRANGPFLKLNCAALPSELVESELFGYERGAFTGAFRSSPGKFELANGGTILLDEIGDMDFRLQAKLLQVLQDGEFLRLGGRQICRVDVRIIAATHCDLEEAIAQSRFRHDLYYRLNVIRIEVPALRQRRDEIIPLAKLFLEKHSPPGAPVQELTLNLEHALLAYGWPGNIRELENAMRTLVALKRPDLLVQELKKAAARAHRMAAHSASGAAADHKIDRTPPEDPPVYSVNEYRYREEAQPKSPGRATSLLGEVDEARKEAEREAILATLQAVRWNRKRAAAELKIEYKALLYKMKKLGIGESAAGAAV